MSIRLNINKVFAQYDPDNDTISIMTNDSRINTNGFKINLTRGTREEMALREEMEVSRKPIIPLEDDGTLNWLPENYRNDYKIPLGTVVDDNSWWEDDPEEELWDTDTPLLIAGHTGSGRIVAAESLAEYAKNSPMFNIHIYDYPKYGNKNELYSDFLSYETDRQYYKALKLIHERQTMIKYGIAVPEERDIFIFEIDSSKKIESEFVGLLFEADNNPDLNIAFVLLSSPGLIENNIAKTFEIFFHQFMITGMFSNSDLPRMIEADKETRDEITLLKKSQSFFFSRNEYPQRIENYVSKKVVG